MSAQHPAIRVRLGALALPVCGLLFVVVLSVRGPLTAPEIDPSGFVRATMSVGFVAGNLGLMVSWISLLFGFMALYAYLANSGVDLLAFAGMVFSVVGVALVLPFVGVLISWHPSWANFTLEASRTPSRCSSLASRPALWPYLSTPWPRYST